jgi:hypothetical protein
MRAEGWGRGGGGAVAAASAGINGRLWLATAEGEGAQCAGQSRARERGW